MICPHPDCTGVHDNNRWAELCLRSRKAKRLKDQRYIYGTRAERRVPWSEESMRSFWVRRHRDALARRRRNIGHYGPGSQYAELFGDDRVEISYSGRKHSEEIERFREREGKRGTRRKIDVICTGRQGVIPPFEVIASSRRSGPELRHPGGPRVAGARRLGTPN